MIARTTSMLLMLIGLSFHLDGQDLIIPDTVCVGEQLEIAYVGKAQEICVSNHSNFLGFAISSGPVTEYPQDEIPLFGHIVQDQSGNYFGFFTNHITTNIVRLEYGNSLLNTPTAYSFTLSEIAGTMEGIQILYDDGQWWGFVTGGNGDEFLLRMSFGNSLSNTPTEENLGAIGGLSFPHDLFFIKEQDTWIGITINKFSHSLTGFYFDDELSNPPLATNLGNFGEIFEPTGLFPIEVDGAWHLFIVNSKSHSLTRIDYDESLSNIPIGTNLGSLGILNRPRDITITKVCDNYIGFVLNRTEDEIILLDFKDDITSVPEAITLGVMGDLSFPHSFSDIHVTEEGILFFVCNVDSKELVRILYEFPDGYFKNCNENISEIEISFTTPGIQELKVNIDNGSSEETTLCKEIVVLPLPDFDLGKDTMPCMGEPLIMTSQFENTLWQNETSSTTYEITESQEYVAEVTDKGCTSRDSIIVEFKDCSHCLVYPNIFSPSEVGENAAFRPIIYCDLDIRSYNLEVYTRWGEPIFKTDDPTVGWDGYSENKESLTGVYVWKTEISYFNGKQVVEEIMAGDLTLVR